MGIFDGISIYELDLSFYAYLLDIFVNWILVI